MRERLGVVTQPRGGFFVCFMAEIWQHFPLIWREPAKNKQAIACWKCCKTHNNVKKILFLHRNFLHKISASLIYEMTYPRVLAIPKSECERTENRRRKAKRLK
jgi:hypothetical protein